jgi:outer membrane protein assembly factor BamD (BamD/ComL family)
MPFGGPVMSSVRRSTVHAEIRSGQGGGKQQMKAITFCSFILVLGLSILVSHRNSSGKADRDTKRAEGLFLDGAKAISEKRYDQGRILLNTMILTYSDSPLREPAKLLVFYSHAQQGGEKNEKAVQLLKEIEEQIKAYEITQRVP